MKKVLLSLTAGTVLVIIYVLILKLIGAGENYVTTSLAVLGAIAGMSAWSNSCWK